MREHRYTVELPRSPARLWAVMQDHDPLDGLRTHGAARGQTGRVRLEPIGRNRTRLHFEERYDLTAAPWKWFEGPIYRLINKQNEASMQRLSAWLTEHPEYRADLVAV